MAAANKEFIVLPSKSLLFLRAKFFIRKRHLFIAGAPVLAITLLPD
ncbi:MAG: hypothetical protein ACI808_000583 [Paraglaciecola sp.]|jgi:hypothetical protein